MLTEKPTLRSFYLKGTLFCLCCSWVGSILFSLLVKLEKGISLQSTFLICLLSIVLSFLPAIVGSKILGYWIYELLDKKRINQFVAMFVGATLGGIFCGIISLIVSFFILSTGKGVIIVLLSVTIQAILVAVLVGGVTGWYIYRIAQKTQIILVTGN